MSSELELRWASSCKKKWPVNVSCARLQDGEGRMPFLLKIDKTLYGDSSNGGGGFESVEALNLVAKEYGYTPLLPGSKVYALRLQPGSLLLATAELVEIPKVRDISEIPRK